MLNFQRTQTSDKVQIITCNVHFLEITKEAQKFKHHKIMRKKLEGEMYDDESICRSILILILH